MGARVAARNVTKIYPDPSGKGEIFALHNLNMEIEPDEFVCIVGQSGCGKTSVLRTIAAKGEGIDELISSLDRHYRYLEKSGDLRQRRRLRLFRRVSFRSSDFWKKSSLRLARART